MNINDLRLLFDYNYWANSKYLKVAEQLSADQFTRHVAGTYGSVRNTLVHTMSAEAGWLERCGGPERGPHLKGEDYPTFKSVVDHWATVEKNMRGFLTSLGEEDLAKPIEFNIGKSPWSLTLREVLQHVANHGVHHRGQMALLLRELGKVPGNVDILFYFGEEKGQ